MSLKIRRGTDEARQFVVLEQGEIAYTTDTKKLFIGDGVAIGGKNVIAQCAGAGLEWNETDQTLQLGAANLTTSMISEGNNLYHTPDRAILAVAGALNHSDHVGMSFSYNDLDDKITGSITALLAADSSPTLGGDLTLNEYNITGTGDIAIDGSIGNTHVSITNNEFIFDSSYGMVVKTSAAGCLEVTTLSSGSTLQGIPHIAIKASNGTIAAPSTLLSSDHVGGLLFRGFAGNSTWTTTSGIYSTLTATSDIGTAVPASVLTVFTGTNSSSMNNYTFDEKGVFSAPILKVGSYATGSLPQNPSAGWIVFDSTVSQFKGYNGSAWVMLG